MKSLDKMKPQRKDNFTLEALEKQNHQMTWRAVYRKISHVTAIWRKIIIGSVKYCIDFRKLLR